MRVSLYMVWTSAQESLSSFMAWVFQLDYRVQVRLHMTCTSIQDSLSFAFQVSLCPPAAYPGACQSTDVVDTAQIALMCCDLFLLC